MKPIQRHKTFMFKHHKVKAELRPVFAIYNTTNWK